MKKLISALSLTLCLGVGSAIAHESDEYTHGSTGRCYGWAIKGSNIRMCYTNPERTTCKDLILTHDTWHVTEEFECTKEEAKDNE